MSQLTEAIDTHTYIIASLSAHTQVSYKDKLAVFASFCEEHHFDLGDISPKVFRQFLTDVATRTNPQTGEPIRGHTISSYGRVVKVFLRWVSSYEEFASCIKTSSLRSFTIPKLEELIKPTLSQTEINKLYTACKQESNKQLTVRDTAILPVLLDTGVRASE